MSRSSPEMMCGNYRLDTPRKGTMNMSDDANAVLRRLAGVEESFEGWEYFYTDVLVQGAYVVDSHLNAEGAAAEEYASGRTWCELQICRGFLGQHEDYFAESRHCSRSDPAWGDSGLELDEGTIKRDDHVLRDVAKSIDLPEGVIFVGLPSVVRLKRLNLIPGCWWKLFHCASKARFGLGGVAPGTGELASLFRCIMADEGQLPDQVIEAGPQRMEDVSSQNAESFRRDRTLHKEHLTESVRVFLYGDFTGHARVEHPQFDIEAIQVFFRPEQLQDRVFH